MLTLETQYLEVPDGKIAYRDFGGSGETVVLLPGIGEMKESYRFLAPLISDAGYRAVAVDNRGEGESTAKWPDYSVESMAADTIALVEALGSQPVHLVGNSKAAATVALVALKRPELVRSLVLVGPFVRDVPVPYIMKLGAKLVMTTPGLWDMYYKTLYKTNKPADFEEYRKRLKKNLSETGRMEALREMSTSSSKELNGNLGQINARTLVVMGSQDPDFKDPAEEAKIIADAMGAQVEMIVGAGHYPQVEFPEQTAKVLTQFLGAA